MQICHEVTCIELRPTAMKLRVERKKEMVAVPGQEPIYVDLGRLPYRIELEAIVDRDAAKKLVVWCQDAAVVKLVDPPMELPDVEDWLIESADAEGLKGGTALRIRLTIVEVTENTNVS